MGMHPPAPSVCSPSEHLEGDETSDYESDANGTHPPWPSDSHPVTQDTVTVIGMQSPFPSLNSLLGQTYGGM